jgi:hypothetical protein
MWRDSARNCAGQYKTVVQVCPNCLACHARRSFRQRGSRTPVASLIVLISRYWTRTHAYSQQTHLVSVLSYTVLKTHERAIRNEDQELPEVSLSHRLDDALHERTHDRRRSRRLSGSPALTTSTQTTSHTDGVYLGSVKQRLKEIESEICRVCGHQGKVILTSDRTGAGVQIKSKCAGCDTQTRWDSSQCAPGSPTTSLASLQKIMEFIMTGQGTYATYKTHLEFQGLVPESKSIYNEVVALTCIRELDELYDSIEAAWRIVEDRPLDEVGSTSRMLVASDGFYLVATKGNGAAGKSPEAVMPMLDVLSVVHVGQ